MKRWTFNTLIVVIFMHHIGASAITLGHLTIVDPERGARDIVYEKKDNYAVVEGDILIAKLSALSAAHSNAPRAIILLKIGGDRWPHGIIPFEIDEDLPFQNKLSVLQAIDMWQQVANVRFVELNSKNRNLYPDYLSFIPTQGTTCSSYVGKQGGSQVVKLSPRCKTLSTAHELGHVLGLWHEQSRSDRDAYIQIVWENIDDNYRYNFDQHLSDGQDYGDYDYESIMHYNAYAFSKNGKKTIVPLQDNIEIGQREHLSTKDIAAVRAMYALR